VSEKPTITRSWLIALDSDDLRVRCEMQRTGKEIERFTVQLELFHQGAWQPVIRYDNAHGFCHRDLLHPDGTQDKEELSVHDANEAFTYANRDVRVNRSAYKERYLREAAS
jgi:hypothetical protein